MKREYKKPILEATEIEVEAPCLTESGNWRPTDPNNPAFGAFN